MHEHTQTSSPSMHDGDVIEIDGPHGAVTALVLLANDQDGDPRPLRRLHAGRASSSTSTSRPYRVFSDVRLAAVA